jgi:hypothetical protein
MSSITTYFSQKDNLRDVILEQLDLASDHVMIAVAWFTDSVLFHKVREIQDKGVRVELIITKHQFNDESANNYNLINEHGGVFIEIGGDHSTMHHKFCIIDHHILLQGSFNWTRKANESNNETLLVIKDDAQSINEFTNEFERLKKLAGLTEELRQLEISKAIQYFEIIKGYIKLGKVAEINRHVHELKHIAELESLVDYLFKGEYDNATTEMDRLSKAFTSVINVSILEKEELVFQIRLLSEQIRQHEIELTEIEEQIDTFNRRSILELNPIIALIIELKKKLYEKLKGMGLIDEEFETLKADYERVKDELEKEQEKDIPNLSENDQKDIKNMYHEASTLCHPDSAKCIFEDKVKAAEIFSNLSTAYKAKDFVRVKEIYEELKSGMFNSKNFENSDIELLRRKLATLEFKHEKVLNAIKYLKITEPYITFSQLKNWDDYFTSQKIILQKEREDLELKYFKQ